MQVFSADEGYRVLEVVADSVMEAKQYLSDIDGAIGDGDHGINMNKGFELAKKEIQAAHGDMSSSLACVSKILMTKIGGAMGPLYGMIFRAMSVACQGKRNIDARVFGDMLTAAEESLGRISPAKVGDKSLLDTLVPAGKAFRDRLVTGGDFGDALDSMKQAAVIGRDSTKNMIARIGRASRLGERSRGVLDAGATSCCLILCSMADSIAEELSSQTADQ